MGICHWIIIMNCGSFLWVLHAKIEYWVQSNLIISQSIITWYFIQHSDSWGRLLLRPWSHQTVHRLLSQPSYWVPVESIFKKNNYVIKGPHSIFSSWNLLILKFLNPELVQWLMYDIYHIEAQTKWPQFHRRHFQVHFLQQFFLF